MRPTLSTRRCVASPEESYSVSCSCNKCNSRPSLQINSIDSEMSKREIEIIIKKLGRINSIFKKDMSKQSANLVFGGQILKLYFDKSIDLELIRQNLLKKQSKIQQDLDVVNKKLNNSSFVKRATKHIVEQEKNIYNNLKINIEKITFTINSLK